MNELAKWKFIDDNIIKLLHERVKGVYEANSTILTLLAPDIYIRSILETEKILNKSLLEQLENRYQLNEKFREEYSFVQEQLDFQKEADEKKMSGKFKKLYEEKIKETQND